MRLLCCDVRRASLAVDARRSVSTRVASYRRATHGRVAWAHSHGQRGVPAGVSWHICLGAWLGVGLGHRLGWGLGWLGHGAQAALLWGFSLWL